MDRAEAFAAVKASFEEAVQSLSISPEPSFLTEGATLTAEKCLTVRQKQINDEEFAVLLRSLQRDTYFATLDVSSNLITNLGARELANVIASGFTSLRTIILENNLIKDKGGDEIEQSKVAAFRKSGRKWVVLATGNPMSAEMVQKLKSSVLDLQQSRRASVAESLPSIKDTSPIQRASSPNWKPFERRSLASDEIFDNEMHVSELKPDTADLPRVDLAEVRESVPDSEIANYRARELTQIPAFLGQGFSIKRLALAGNRIVKIENLPESLEALELKKNLITSMAGLEGLALLRYLDLSENKLTVISGLDTNLAMRELSLAANSIKQVSGLEHLRELRRLNLANNNISGFMSIRTVSMNVQLKMLILQGNPLFLQAKYKISVCNLLPRLVLLDFIPVFSWKGESFKKSQGKMPFFSIDFADSMPESARTKVTPRFPDKQFISTTRRNPLYLDIPDTDNDPFAQTRPKSTTKAKPWAPRLKRPNNRTMQTGIDTQTSVLHNAQKSTSAHTTYFLPEETDGPYPLSSKEKEDIQRQLRSIPLFRGLAGEVFRELLENAERQHALKGDVIQEGDVIVSQMLLIVRGKVQWKSITYGQWSVLFVDSLVVPVEAEDTVVSIEATDYISFQRKFVSKVLDMYPESKDLFYRNYDNIQLAAEKPMFLTPDTPSYASPKKLLTPASRRSVMSQSSQIPKINLKQLIKSETSQTLGLTTITTDPRSLRAQIDIEKMLSNDPLRPDSDFLSQPQVATVESFSDWKDAVKSLEEHVSGLMSFYQKETRQERDKLAIDDEAKEFVVKGPTYDFELMALHRPALRECVEQAFMVPMSESISEIKPEGWIEEYVSVLSHDEDEAMKQTLDSWLLSLQRDIEMCILALSNILLVGRDETLIASQFLSYKDVVDELDLTEIRANPKEYLSSFCGQRVSNPDIAEKVRQITEIVDKCNYCKECLDRLTAAADCKDTATVEALQTELVQEGVLSFSLLPSQLFLTKKKPQEGAELKARVWIRQSQAMSPDSSVTSGVSSRGDLF